MLGKRLPQADFYGEIKRGRTILNDASNTTDNEICSRWQTVIRTNGGHSRYTLTGTSKYVVLILIFKYFSTNKCNKNYRLLYDKKLLISSRRPMYF